jgi:DNA adenine methylase
VLILDAQDALAVIRKQDGSRTLFYLDPPYLHATRATTGEYEHEMLCELPHIKGRFLLSGYHSDLYDDHAKLRGWKCHEKQINNHAAGGKTKRVMTECVWTNF